MDEGLEGISQGLGKPTDVKKRLQKMELLACNLMVQLILCVFAVIFTVTVYFLKYQSSKCWALPFQESPCKRSRALPSIATNQSTLSDAVDEFVLALQTEISAFYSVVEVPFTLLRQSLFTFTKTKIGQLLNQHSADLVAFGALKREDERLEELELAIEEGYFQIFNFQYALIIFLLCFVAIPIVLLNSFKPIEKHKQKKSSAEESENSENIRLKKLKRRIPFLYIGTFVCIAVELALFFMLVAGVYHGNSPVFRGYKNFKCNATDSCDVLRQCEVKVSFSDYLSFSTELESNLDKRIAELGTSMGSPNLENCVSVAYYVTASFVTAGSSNF
ncbi:hypothetical protein Ddc_13936 [Ditylenchus destructor]|nr:hypothetical protein Ddc_13936 [Ditylenchus destructor]